MKLLRSKWILLLLFVMAGSLVFALLDQNARRAEFREAARSVGQKVAEAEAETGRFEKFIDYFKSPQFMEKQARAKLNYKFPDEGVAFVFKDTTEPGLNNRPAEEAPNYMKWWYYILGN